MTKRHSAPRDSASRPRAKRMVMAQRLKKLVGFFLFLPALMIYFFAAAALGERVPNHQLLKALYYLAAGIAWAFPAKYLFVWMNRPSNPAKPVSNRD